METKKTQPPRRPRRRRRRNPQALPLSALLAVAVALAFSLHWVTNGRAAPPSPAAPEPTTAASSAPTPIRRSGAGTGLLYSQLRGDCTLGTDAYFDPSTSLPAYADKYGLDYFLSNVRGVFTADDLTIVNFEGTLTRSAARADKTYAFKGDPSYTEILTSGGVEACNLANNHSHDYGADSYTDTKTALQGAGLTTFGYDETAVLEINGVKVGLVGVYELAKLEGCAEDLEAAMADVKAQGAEVILVSFHWGIERNYVPNQAQISLAHRAVDLGASLVIGHHPHVLQGIEAYNGVNIVYSLGNFCFGGNKNPSDKDTLIYQQTFTVRDGQVQIDLENGVNLIPCSLSSQSSRNDYRPTPASGSEAERILDKLNTYSQQIRH